MTMKIATAMFMTSMCHHPFHHEAWGYFTPLGVPSAP